MFMVCRMGAGCAAYAVIAAHLSSLSFLPVFVIHSFSLSTHGLATFQLGPHGPRDPIVYGRFLMECVCTQTT